MNENLDPHGVLPAIEAGELKVLRQSNIGTGDVCGLRLQYELDPEVPRGTGEARIAGTAYHAGQAHYWEERQRSGDVVPSPATIGGLYDAAMDAFKAAMAEGEMAEWATSEDASRQRVLNLLFHYFNAKLYWGEDFEVLAVEQTFFMPLGVDGWAVQGTPDLVLRHVRTGRHKIVDHKTAGRRWQRGKEDPRKNNQAPWYVYWWRQLTDETASFTFDIITPPDIFERRNLRPSERHQDAVLLKAHKWVGLIDAGIDLPPNTTSNLCSKAYCDYWHRCPWGAALTARPEDDADADDDGGVVDGPTVPVAA